VDDSAEWARFVVVVLWLAWLSTMLLTYWGAPRTARRVLMAFGSFWLVFVVTTLVGDAMSGETLANTLLGSAVGVGVVAPFFGLAWASGRYPRQTGIALLGIAAIFLLAFGGGSALAWSTRVMTQTLLAGPVLVSGLALLLGSGGGEED